MNIFSEFYFAIAGVKKYPKFLQNKGGKVFLYVMFAVLVYTAIANAKVIPGTSDFVQEAKELVQNKVPDFEMKNGELSVAETIYFEADGVVVSATSEYGAYIKDYDKNEWRQLLSDYKGAFIFDTNTILFMEGDSGRLEIIDYQPTWNFTKDFIYELIDYSYVFVGIYLVFAYIFNIIGFIIGALIVALIGMIIDSVVSYGLTFGQLFKLSIYAKTCMLLVKALLKFAGISFFGMFILVIAVSCVYLGFALSHMKKEDEQENEFGSPIIF